MNANMPTMLSASAASSTYSADAFQFGQAANNLNNLIAQKMVAHGLQNQSTPAPIKPKGVPMSARRVVQVFIADPNENMPLDDCLLFKGDEKLTDATDQELFFELDIKALLEAHNAKRIKVIDKAIKDRTEYLEPAKVRDLKMVVVTVASL